MNIIRSFAFLIIILVVLNSVKCEDDSDNANNTNTMTVIIVVTIPTINATTAPVQNKTTKSQQKYKNVTTTTIGSTPANNITQTSNERLLSTSEPESSVVDSTKTAPFYIPYYIPKNKLGKLFSALCHPTCLKQKRSITQKCLKNMQLLDIYNKCELNTGPAYSCVHCCMKIANETSIPLNGGHYGYQISCVRRTMSRDEHVCVDKYVKTVRRDIRRNYGYQTARSV